MTDMSSTEHYIARERRERELAESATDPADPAIHREMAERYSELATPRLRLVASPR